MFIKILTPNHNGKIELTVRDLEALIEEAVEKAIREKCAGCTKIWYNTPGISYLRDENLPNYTITSATNSTENIVAGEPIQNKELSISLDTFADTAITANKNDFTSMVNALSGEKFNNNKRGNL